MFFRTTPADRRGDPYDHEQELKERSCRTGLKLLTTLRKQKKLQIVSAPEDDEVEPEAEGISMDMKRPLSFTVETQGGRKSAYEAMVCPEEDGELDIAFKGVSEVPEDIRCMQVMAEFNAANNKIKELPDAIGEVVTLTKMDLHSNMLVKLPKTIGQLSSLETLILDGNKLEKLPKTMCKMQALETLWASENSLEIFPDLMIWLQKKGIWYGCSALQVVNVSFNKLTVLPDSIGSLESLRELYANGNLLTRVPDTLAGCTKLQKVELQDNQLQGLPENIGKWDSVSELLLNRNGQGLHTLPETFGRMHSLRRFMAHSNDLRQLPSSFGQLRALEELELYNNPLLTGRIPIELTVQRVKADYIDTRLAAAFVVGVSFSSADISTVMGALPEEEVRERIRKPSPLGYQNWQADWHRGLKEKTKQAKRAGRKFHVYCVTYRSSAQKPAQSFETKFKKVCLNKERDFDPEYHLLDSPPAYSILDWERRIFQQHKDDLDITFVTPELQPILDPDGHPVPYKAPDWYSPAGVNLVCGKHWYPVKKDPYAVSDKPKHSTHNPDTKLPGGS
jgi:Leucine-rich repeat (LRR) protein